MSKELIDLDIDQQILEEYVRSKEDLKKYEAKLRQKVLRYCIENSIFLPMVVRLKQGFEGVRCHLKITPLGIGNRKIDIERLADIKKEMSTHLDEDTHLPSIISSYNITITPSNDESKEKKLIQFLKAEDIDFKLNHYSTPEKLNRILMIAAKIETRCGVTDLVSRLRKALNITEIAITIDRFKK